jgi:hypothetical protein
MLCLGDLPAPGWRDGLTARSKATVIDQRRAPFRHRQPHPMPRAWSRQCRNGGDAAAHLRSGPEILDYQVSGDQGKPRDHHGSG